MLSIPFCSQINPGMNSSLYELLPSLICGGLEVTYVGRVDRLWRTLHSFRVLEGLEPLEKLFTCIHDRLDWENTVAYIYHWNL